ncbi:MAG: trigger factor [Gloeomargarita sp. HHBFW_bins_162]
MKITQESLPNSQLGLRVEIPADEVAKRHDTIFKKLLKNVRLPGFRPGKVPPHILRQYVGDAAIGASVVEELVETAMPQALKQLDVPTIGEPRLRDEMETLVHNFQPNQPFVFQMAIDVWPEVTLGDYHNLQVRAARYEFDPANVDEILQHHQYLRATLVPVERPAQIGDVAIIDLDAYYQTETGRGDVVPELECRDMEVDVTEDDEEFYQEVLTALVGMQVGETKSVTLVTDAEFWEENLANQTFILEFTLKELKERELPELDDLFAQAISDCETMAELRNFLLEREQKRAEERTQETIEMGITDALVEITTTELPQTFVQRHLADLFSDLLEGFQKQGVDPKELNDWLTEERMQAIGTELLPAAERRVKRFLALRTIAERENLHPDPEELAQNIAQARRSPIAKSLSEAELEQVVRESMRQKLALEWLQERAQITFLTPEEWLRQRDQLLDADEPSPASDTEAESPEATPTAATTEPSEPIQIAPKPTPADAKD